MLEVSFLDPLQSRRNALDSLMLRLAEDLDVAKDLVE
jgi:hypothetical protein